VLVGPTPPAHACSCAFSGERQLYDLADLVVEGTVTAVEPADLDRFADARVTIAVDRVLKGPQRATVTVGASLRQSDASCRYAFSTGVRYRVYAKAPSRPIAADGLTSLCSGNQELERLPVPTPTPPPAAAPPPPPTTDPHPIGPVVALAVATAGVIGLAAADRPGGPAAAGSAGGDRRRGDGPRGRARRGPPPLPDRAVRRPRGGHGRRHRPGRRGRGDEAAAGSVVGVDRVAPVGAAAVEA
jgi:hypothetical protein